MRFCLLISTVLIIAVLFLLLHHWFRNDNSLSKKSGLPSNHALNGNSCARNLQEKNCFVNPHLTNIVNLLHDDNSKTNLITDNFPSYKNIKSVTANSVSSDSRFIKFINRYPALSFRLNIPDFDCFHDSLFLSFFEAIRPLYEYSTNNTINVIKISNISIEKVFKMVQFVNAISLMILDFDRDFKFDTKIPTEKKSNCLLNYELSFALLFSNYDDYVAVCSIVKLPTAALRVFPRAGTFHQKFPESFPITIEYDKIERIVVVSLNEYENAKFQKSEQFKNEIIGKMSEHLFERIDNLTDNFAFQILQNITSYSNQSTGYNLAILNGAPLTEKIEFVTFTIKSNDYFNLTILESRDEFATVSSLVSIQTSNLTSLLITEVQSRSADIVEFNVPSLLQTNMQYVKSLNRRKELKMEQKFRECFVKELEEMQQLTIKLWFLPDNGKYLNFRRFE